MKHFNFVKISGRWFVDVPYNGSVSDLEMVDGADTFLEAYSEGDSKVVHVMIMESGKTITVVYIFMLSMGKL